MYVNNVMLHSICDLPAAWPQLHSNWTTAAYGDITLQVEMENSLNLNSTYYYIFRNLSIVAIVIAIAL